MIAQLTGTVLRAHPLVLDVNGVGYLVSVPQNIPTTIGETLTVHTYTHVREDTLQLFGFASEEELSLFELLLTVSGIGPKTALAVMDQGVASIQKAITSSDVDFFMTVPRLGKKNAQKIIIELRSKIAGTTGDIPETGETSQISSALISMGFDRNELKEILKKLPDGSIEEKITFALKMLG